ncbi:MAG: hypothetical protein K5694_02945 [Bacilli bacterium]|nr:hypothetical protein [Bacilli bacterium]
MRRKLAYIFLSGALLLGAAATIGPTITRMDSDLTYASGRELYYRISDKNTTYNGVQIENYVENDNYVAVNAVADEMSKRLENWGVEADVTKVGYDTVKVSIRAQEDDSIEYDYLEKYLAFSGGNLTITAGCSDSSVQEKADQTYSSGEKYSNNAMFEGQNADITYVNGIPVVTIPVNYPGEDGEMNALIKFCSDNTKAADSSASTAEVNCYLVIWTDRQEGDTYEAASNSSAKNYDPNMSKRLIFGEAVGSNGANAWYNNGNEDDNYKTLQLIPNSEALSENGYDASKSGAAYKAAFYYKSLLNASSYREIGAGYDVNFAYYTLTSASVESLVNLGDWNRNPAWNMTALASIAFLVILAAVLIAFYRMGSLAILGNAAVTLMGTLLLVVYFHAQFGIGMLIGLGLVVLASVFGGIYYFGHFKQELYQGRSAKKAHTEAIKKSLWPTIDVGVASIVIGLCVYGLIPSVVGKLGLVLVFGGAIGAIVNIIMLRIEGFLLAEDNKTQENLDKVYGVDKAKIPNLLAEEKPSYDGLYGKTNFQKNNKWLMPVLGIVCVAAIAGVSVFSAMKSTFNYAGAYADTTALQVEYRVQSGPNNNLLLDTDTKVKQNYLDTISYKDGENTVALTATSIEYPDSDSRPQIYDSTIGDDGTTYDVYYYNIKLSKTFDLNKADYEWVLKVGDTTETMTGSLQEALDQATYNLAGTNPDLLKITAENVVVTAGIPSLGTVYLALGISLAAMLVYTMMRFRISRGAALTLIAGASGVVAVGLFSLTRIATTPIVTMGAILATYMAFLLGFFLLNKEKEIFKESRERDKNNLAFRSECLQKANSLGAEDLVIFAFMGVGMLIVYWGFGAVSFTTPYLASFAGVIFALVSILTLLVPFALFLARQLAKVHIDFRLFKKNAPNTSGNAVKKKSGEPEEAIIIGIND